MPPKRPTKQFIETEELSLDEAKLLRRRVANRISHLIDEQKYTKINLIDKGFFTKLGFGGEYYSDDISSAEVFFEGLRPFDDIILQCFCYETGTSYDDFFCDEEQEEAGFLKIKSKTLFIKYGKLKFHWIIHNPCNHLVVIEDLKRIEFPYYTEEEKQHFYKVLLQMLSIIFEINFTDIPRPWERATARNSGLFNLAASIGASAAVSSPPNSPLDNLTGSKSSDLPILREYLLSRGFEEYELAHKSISELRNIIEQLIASDSEKPHLLEDSDARNIAKARISRIGREEEALKLSEFLLNNHFSKKYVDMLTIQELRMKVEGRNRSVVPSVSDNTAKLARDRLIANGVEPRLLENYPEDKLIYLLESRGESLETASEEYLTERRRIEEFLQQHQIDPRIYMTMNLGLLKIFSRNHQRRMDHLARSNSSELRNVRVGNYRYNVAEERGIGGIEISRLHHSTEAGDLCRFLEDSTGIEFSEWERMTNEKLRNEVRIRGLESRLNNSFIRLYNSQRRNTQSNDDDDE